MLRACSAPLPWTAFLSLVAMFTSGCQFFGKQSDQTPAATPGVLADGSSIVGSWSASYGSVAANGQPNTAVTMTFTFDPTGAVRIEERSALSGGTICTGFGQYREPSANEILIYMQAANPTTCVFPAQLHLSQVKIGSYYFSYVDPSSNSVSHLFRDRAQLAAPLGVWFFNGAGGIDYIFFDHHGYFLLQTTLSGVQYLMQGYYVVSNGGISLKYFANGDPAQVGGTSDFDGFIANDQNLRLIQTTTTGELDYDAVRL